LRWYREDPDPGLHSAIDWLLRHGKEGPESRPFDWGQAQALKTADATLAGKAPPPGQRWLVSKTGQTFALFPGPVELPQQAGNRLQLGHGFALATTPVTLAQLRKVIPRGVLVEHDTYHGSSEDGPAGCVRFYSAVMYCRWLSEQEGVPEGQMCFPPIPEIQKCWNERKPMPLPTDYLKRTGYRLPTETEWEYACRAGAGTTRYFGSADELLGRYAWFLDNARDQVWPVGQKKPNDFGLFDMHGNVRQWCTNVVWRASPEVPGLQVEDKPTAAFALGDSLHMCGASYAERAGKCGASVRWSDNYLHRSSENGFRIARTWP